MSPKLTLAFFPICFLSALPAAEILRSNNNTTALNTLAAWQGGALPTSADTIAFDSTGVSAAATATSVAATNLMGADLSIAGIKVGSNVLGTINTAIYLAIHNNGSATPFTLSIGGSGIDMGSANHALRIQGKINLTANQTWNVTDANTLSNVMAFNNGEDLAFDATSLGQQFEMNGSTVTVNGTGRTTITSGFTLNNGTFNINNTFFEIQSGGSRNTTVNSNVTLNVAAGSILHFQSNSAVTGAGANAMVSNATINLNGGVMHLTPNNPTFGITIGGTINILNSSIIRANPSYTNSVNNAVMQVTGNITGSAALSLQNGLNNTNPLRIGGDNSGYTGTVTVEAATNPGTTPLTIYQAVAPTNRAIRLTSNTAGSAAATWVVNTPLELDGVSVDLGTLNGGGATGNITNSSTLAAANLKVGAGSYSGIISNGASQSTSLSKLTTGTLTLAGANTYTGTTTVSGGGALNVSGSLGNTAVTVSGLSTLRGAGSIGGGITVIGSTLQLGDGITREDLAVTGAISLDSASTLKLTIDSESALDKLTNLGTFSSTGALLDITFNDTTFVTGTTSGDLAAATRYTFISGPVDTAFTFSNATSLSAGDMAALGLSGTQYEATFAGQRFWLERGSLALVPIAPIPEPTGVLLTLLSGMALVLRRRR
jgi:autotransporter-associated beta strand protein